LEEFLRGRVNHAIPHADNGFSFPITGRTRTDVPLLVNES